jgi:bacterioferritin-associated ferredoxin
MIVCVCNNVSEKKLRQAVEAGMTTMADLRNKLEVGTCCGKCASCAKRILRECVDKAMPAHLHQVHFHPNLLAA